MREEIHYTVEEIMSMPGYCRDKYEREIIKVRSENNGLNTKAAMDEIHIGLLEGKLEKVHELIAEFPDYQFNAMGWEKYDRKEVDEWITKLKGLIGDSSTSKSKPTSDKP